MISYDITLYYYNVIYYSMLSVYAFHACVGNGTVGLALWRSSSPDHLKSRKRTVCTICVVT